MKPCTYSLLLLCLFTPALAQAPPSPATGDIILHGTILKNKVILLVSVDSVIAPTGQTSPLSPPHIKTIRLSPSTQYTGVRRGALVKGSLVWIEVKDGSRKSAAALGIWKQQAEVGTAEAAPPLIPSPGLQHMVEDYNDLLIKAQEANKYWHAMSDSEDTTIATIRISPDDQQAELSKESNSTLAEMTAGITRQKDLLRRSEAMRATILSIPHYAELYHETHICLAPEEITTDMPEAKDLRFIEKR